MNNVSKNVSDDVSAEVGTPAFDKFFRVFARHHSVTVFLLSQEYGKYISTVMNQSAYIFCMRRGFASFSQILMRFVGGRYVHNTHNTVL